jgi:hypothetical protein
MKQQVRQIVKSKRTFFIIMILIIGLSFLAFSKYVNLSDGIGFGRGQDDGLMYFGLGKADFKNGHFVDSIYWMFLGSKTIIDSEIEWNRAQPYIKQYNVLVEQGKLKEALAICPKIDELIRKYDLDGGILTECYLLGQRLNQP